MRRNLHITIAVIAVQAATAAISAPTEELGPRAPSFDLASVARAIDAARQARRHGDVSVAERLCYTAFQIVDDSALAAYDAFADRLNVEHRAAEEVTVRAQSAQLHELKAQQLEGTTPTTTYLGFSTSGGLQAYADLLLSLGKADDAERMRSLALAYQQVQQAHFQRMQLLRQGKDPRGSC